MTSLLQDLRFALRQLRRAPGFALTVIGTLGLAVGATAAMSGVLRATLLSSLPYPQPGQLIEIADHNLTGFKTNGLVTVARSSDIAALERDGHRIFSSLGFFYPNAGQIYIDGREPVATAGAAVSGTFFQTLGIVPQMGRAIGPADDVRNAPLVCVLSDHLWRSAFAADANVLGRTARLGTEQATIVGVMSPRLAFPADADLWYPGHIFPENFAGYRGDGSRFLQVVARTDPRESFTSARAAIDQLAGRLSTAYPATDAGWSFDVQTLRASLFGDLRQGLLLLSAAIGLVLIVVTVNIAGLQLSRNAGRQAEFAIRSALGVRRARLVRQLLTESILLVGAGSIAGVALGGVFLRLINLRLPALLLRVQRPHVDLSVLAVTCALALVVGVLTGIVPALEFTRPGVLAAAGRTVGGGRSSRTFGRAFTVAQIALALVLLTVSAGVLESLYHLLNTRLGFDAEQLQTFSVDLGWNVDEATRHRIYEQTEAAIAALPGVSSVGAGSALPLTDLSVRVTFDIRGRAPTLHHDAIIAEYRSLSPGYLGAMRIPLLAGRAFTARDADPKAPPVLLINQTMARQYFPGQNPVGQHLLAPPADLHVAPGGSSLVDAGEIIGVVADVHGTGGALSNPLQPEIDAPEKGGWPHTQFAVRTSLPAASLEPAIRRIVTGLNASASVSHFSTMSTTIGRSLAQPRLNAALLSAFAALSLLLVVIGVYGLVAFDVARRTRELGLRMALGASRGGVLRLVLGESARILAAGLAIGIVGSFLASRLTASAVYGAASSSAALLLLTAVLLSAAVLAATLLPARRASMVDPMHALRSE